ncbi:MAG: group III truncated hemoglobin [Xanthobacteraceae bacterium]
MNENAEAGAARRNLIVADIVERTGIDEPMIDRLIRGFYARARRDPLIGPIFDREVHDWEAHFARMRDFWSSVALMSGRYHGQPMAAHLPLPIDTPHFNRWLELFAATARELCAPAAAAHFIERAHRIADSLELGIATQRGEIRSPPPRPASSQPPDRARAK